MKKIISILAVTVMCAGCFETPFIVGTRNTTYHIEGGTNYITNTPSGGSRMGLNEDLK